MSVCESTSASAAAAAAAASATTAAAATAAALCTLTFHLSTSAQECFPPAPSRCARRGALVLREPPPGDRRAGDAGLVHLDDDRWMQAATAAAGGVTPSCNALCHSRVYTSCFLAILTPASHTRLSVPPPPHPRSSKRATLRKWNSFGARSETARSPILVVLLMASAPRGPRCT